VSLAVQPFCRVSLLASYRSRRPHGLQTIDRSGSRRSDTNATVRAGPCELPNRLRPTQRHRGAGSIHLRLPLRKPDLAKEVNERGLRLEGRIVTSVRVSAFTVRDERPATTLPLTILLATRQSGRRLRPWPRGQFRETQDDRQSPSGSPRRPSPSRACGWRSPLSDRCRRRAPIPGA
jgi:hypothetical protein